MFKMGFHDPFGHFKQSYDQKKGHESNWQFDSQPLKVGNHPNFLVFRWHATYRWKILNEVYNFASDLISIGDLRTKLWAPKVVGVPTMGISGFQLGSPETKWHSGADPMANHKVYYKGKVVASPKSEPWRVLWVHGYLWFVRAPKCSNYALTNLFGFVQVLVSKWIACQSS
jgi:hypothetical protein